ncbi:ABC transporter ATP-binding protein [Castellaniella defragrans]|uniref:Branched-chain amino acid transport ATP-binding protein LivF n=2 Tax=Castellaniella defragrans TaxID=75697 RepID=W8X4D1_CASD6|nr:ABC transporter ATP-binding protein [Castellaniella defragrans]KAB0615993.1 ABC transporter ATP-binding protein [Castellaniella defragrans]MBB6082321.1 branched-chain amino acid transport system ATP-binding protein [Castellaniella defragrans]CDM24742.1 Branched-chain amino acid transport ATP-binding protein LivF [Castellaniella defragrans 65Phen]
MTAPLLQIEDLRVSYGHIQALKGISLHVQEKEVVAILGANGAGKTTLMRTLSGLITPQSGKITFAGHDTTRMGADRIVRLGIGQSPEGRRVFGTLSVEENLRMGGFTRPAGETEASCEHVYKIFPRLYERRAQLAGTLSGGEQQMLAIGRALVTKPRLLLLDEPSLGLAPIIVRNIFQVLREVRDTGVTILIVEQNARMALKLADRGYVLEVGKLSHEGSSRELLSSPEIQAAYLGH